MTVGLHYIPSLLVFFLSYTGAGLSSQPKSEHTVKQSSSTQTSTDDITSLSPMGLQTSGNNISSTPMTTANEMIHLVSTQRTDVSSMDKNTIPCC